MLGTPLELVFTRIFHAAERNTTGPVQLSLLSQGDRQAARLPQARLGEESELRSHMG